MAAWSSGARRSNRASNWPVAVARSEGSKAVTAQLIVRLSKEICNKRRVDPKRSISEPRQLGQLGNCRQHLDPSPATLADADVVGEHAAQSGH